MTGHVQLRAAPVAVHYSDGYQSELRRIWIDLDMANRTGCLQPESLVWRARGAYRAAWRRELIRFRETR